VHRYRKLMVGLARTNSDAGLIEYAAAVARLGTAEEIRFVHVVPESDEGTPAGECDRVAPELQADVSRHFTGVDKTVRTSCVVVAGPLMDRLLEQAAEHHVDLILVGHSRRHSGRRAIARRLAMKAPCSVWMVPDGWPAVIGRILAPTDFSEHAGDTMNVAVALARLTRQSEVLALHVYFDESVARFEGYDRVLREQSLQSFEKQIAKIDRRDVAVTPVLEEGPNVANAILRVAERTRSDLIVMGTRGRSRSAAILLGSVTEETIIATRIPLLVVKHFGAQMGMLQVLLNRDFLQRGNPRTD
jgi:nucleotide-binding universal stress UspA family protein